MTSRSRDIIPSVVVGLNVSLFAIISGKARAMAVWTAAENDDWWTRNAARMLARRRSLMENQKECSRMSTKPNIVIWVEAWNESGMKQVDIPAEICNACIRGL